MNLMRTSMMGRRNFLRGAGATLALPFLEAAQPKAAKASAPPTRMAFFYVPNGENRNGATNDQENQLLELDLLAVDADDRLEQVHGPPVDDLEPAAVEDVNDQRNGQSRHP